MLFKHHKYGRIAGVVVYCREIINTILKGCQMEGAGGGGGWQLEFAESIFLIKIVVIVSKIANSKQKIENTILHVDFCQQNNHFSQCSAIVSAGRATLNIPTISTITSIRAKTIQHNISIVKLCKRFNYYNGGSHPSNTRGDSS